ncbi:MAG TPA: nitrite/sulfite reductase [Acidimicrobiales bacterium]|jgi:sulfite reductase beta subunit-like hemoprotein|nr:nitrite/sulfite reductase [Acidimicrobiales bacterium]MDP6214017.1 nitrite/sulfite reductase [Acidimicrobiales bacterium]MDP7209905.1 nitrite/sulfite reductase [Acidimicrobiales bacterium]HJL89364.1 nitrite/sulfite reductase [Acidimicrobiales bacterium]HJO99221.1 nitrite/sulfite reductase [Acidimicrobiales bacterium]|tara:strand:- start:2763 stop:4565 length:1803 start_codon:yes stop_codon:yes gene_type:complete
MAQLTSPTAPTRPVTPTDPDIEADIAKFEEILADYQSGRVDEDVFRVFRLNNGIYGQRQGGTNQMVRVKVPYGSMTADQLDMLGSLVEDHSRGWGHITTRQNLQFHYVELTEVPEVMKKLASVGLTTREACGDTVRNVQGCHLAGACPFEVLDITAWAEAAYRHFVRNPIAQRLPRKFKINFSGCATDCGQAMFNDAGIVATSRTFEDGSVEQGFRVYIAGGLGTTPFPALALEEFTTREDLLPTIESILRVFDQTGNRDNKLRARMKWVVDQLGIDEVRRRIFATRKLLPASATWPGGIPDVVAEWGDTPAGTAPGATPTPVGTGVPVSIGTKTPYDRWAEANVVRGIGNGTVSAYAWCALGDITGDQFRAMAAVVRNLDVDIRVTNRQNFIVRNLDERQLPELFDMLEAAGMARPGAELSRDVVACPGADTCNLAVTQSRGLAQAIGDALDEAGLAEVGGVRTNISGCTNSCGQHHTADIGFFGAERRAHGKAAPGYQMLLGGHVGDEQIQFGQKALRLPARNAPEAAVRVIGRFVDEREAGEPFHGWLKRSGGASGVATNLKDLDEFPTPDEGPGYYVDFDETGPYVAEIGDSECAT